MGKDGLVLAGRFRPEHNREPDLVLAGTKPRVKLRADQLCTQPQPIPVFWRRGAHKWEYAGRFVVDDFFDDSENIEKYATASRPAASIYRVICLKPVD